LSLSARHLLLLAENTASLQALFAQSYDRLPLDGLPRCFSIVGAAAVMLPTASVPCWAKVTSGESDGTICWIDFMIAWSLIELKSRFTF
jgi:hypothetical protein